MTAPAKGEEFKDDVRRRLAPDAVALLTRRSAWCATLAIVHDLAVNAAAIGVALAFWPNPWVIAAAVIVIGTRQQALFVIAHDAAHYLLTDSRRLNDLAGRLCATLAGLSMCTYRVVHRLHHNNLYGALDPDTALHGGYPRGKAYLAKKLLKDLAGLTAWKTYAYFFGAPAINDETNVALRPLNDTSPRLRTEAQRDRRWVIGLHLAALAIAAASGFLLEYLVLWILPLVTVVQAILRLRAICEHGAVSDTRSPLTAARTNQCPAWLAWLLFPHNVNYHIEHHLYASVPMHQLPALHRELMAQGLLEGAAVMPVRVTLGKIFADPLTRTEAH